jgi:flagellar protein FliS
MYATATQTYTNVFSSRSVSNAYRQIGVETGIAGAHPHSLITMLFDGTLEAIAQARGAIQKGDIEGKGRLIGKAVSIVEEGLKGGLDLQAGGEIAHNLHALYTYIAGRLIQANLRSDAQALEECAGLLTPLRDAWISIRAEASAQTTQKVSA